MIGIFDSGFGGLTILKSLIKELPNYNYIYLGDNARIPYGSKSQELIYDYTKEAVDFLFDKGCELIIIACNSASSKALRKIQKEYLPTKYPNKKVLGVIRPLAEKISENNIKKVGVIGTEATINSHIYKQEIKDLNSQIEVFEKATPLLVPLIEEGKIDNKETDIILEKYLESFKTEKIESLILGCTHYPFLQNKIQKIMGEDCLIENPGEVIAESLNDYLDRHRELNIKTVADYKIKFYTTDDVNKFKKIGEKFLSGEIKDIEKCVLK